jgi:hypothetical protein
VKICFKYDDCKLGLVTNIACKFGNEELLRLLFDTFKYHEYLEKKCEKRWNIPFDVKRQLRYVLSSGSCGCVKALIEDYGYEKFLTKKENKRKIKSRYLGKACKSGSVDTLSYLNNHFGGFVFDDFTNAKYYDDILKKTRIIDFISVTKKRCVPFFECTNVEILKFILNLPETDDNKKLVCIEKSVSHFWAKRNIDILRYLNQEYTEITKKSLLLIENPFFMRRLYKKETKLNLNLNLQFEFYKEITGVDLLTVEFVLDKIEYFYYFFSLICFGLKVQSSLVSNPEFSSLLTKKFERLTEFQYDSEKIRKILELEGYQYPNNPQNLVSECIKNGSWDEVNVVNSLKVLKEKFGVACIKSPKSFFQAHRCHDSRIVRKILKYLLYDCGLDSDLKNESTKQEYLPFAIKALKKVICFCTFEEVEDCERLRMRKKSEKTITYLVETFGSKILSKLTEKDLKIWCDTNKSCFFNMCQEYPELQKSIV